MLGHTGVQCNNEDESDNVCYDAGQGSHSNVEQSTCCQEQATEVGG